ncbi:hypothetical protein ACFL6I_28695, partial [candidate division KSB1 bacterium]
PSYGTDNRVTNPLVYFHKWYAGIKIERRAKNNKLGLLTGLRYTRVNSSFGKSYTWLDNDGYFYLLYKQEGTTTEYLKIKEVNQYSDYLGIPLEIRHFPFNPRFFRFFLKAAAEFNYRLSTTNDVVFNNDKMESFQAGVAEKFGEPDNFFSMLYFALGLKLGNDNKTNVSLEAVFPSFYLSDNTSSLVIPQYGGGFQINIQIPL